MEELEEYMFTGNEIEKHEQLVKFIQQWHHTGVDPQIVVTVTCFINRLCEDKIILKNLIQPYFIRFECGFRVGFALVSIIPNDYNDMEVLIDRTCMRLPHDPKKAVIATEKIMERLHLYLHEYQETYI